MQKNLVSNICRRNFLACGAAVIVAPFVSLAAGPAKTQVWVQLTTGGHSYRPSFQEMFLDPMFLEEQIWPLDHPGGFNALVQRGTIGGGPAGANVGATRGALGGAPTLRDEPPDYPWEPSGGRAHPGYDVLVLNDQLNWPDRERETAQKAVEAGRGFVLIHNSLGDNQNWPWWYQEVVGGLLVLDDHNGMKKSTITPSATLDVRPAGRHPILRDIGPFRVREEAYRGMWQSPKITPLLETTGSTSDRTVAWVGVHPKARVVCIQPGAAREDPPQSGVP